MDILWNQVNLQRPPCRSWDISVREFDPTTFLTVIDRVLNDFQNFKTMHAEAALLSRLIYRMKSKFRSDKGLKHMEKVNRALLNYLNMSLDKEYELLKECTEINNSIVSLPPQQTLEYVLVRTQGFAKLMCRVESTCMIAAYFFKSRLHIGQSWPIAMVAYGVISRIWMLSRHIIKKSCAWYDSVYKYVKMFQKVGIPWLPDAYVLPENLADWLKLSWIEDFENFSTKGQWDRSIFDLIEAINTIEPDCVIETLTAENSSSKQNPIQANISVITEDIDYGVPVSREVFGKCNDKSSKNLKTKAKKRIKKQNHTLYERLQLLNVKCERDIVNFLKADYCPGYDKLQWRILQKRVKKFVIKLTKNNTCDLNDQQIKKVDRRIKKLTSSI
ncbi:uncharacterized protein LOC131664722 [Phymastichus coffea]|uniref:uncharacterized protein LOC131664722 n=1 Tax=Phymastichus coffea TaxID=108790 RepID=UPI00273B8F0F|nr:uncharacterized protein LOC131664722 [Phymastichus coffea]